MYPGFSIGVKPAEDASVFTDRIIDPAHEGGDIGIEIVIVRGPAMIGAKLFIPTAMNGFIANLANSFIVFHFPEA